MAKAVARAANKDATPKVVRADVLAGGMASYSWVGIAPAGHASRLSLRAPRASLAALSQALDLELPTKPKTSVTKGRRAALWLGPDEWLLIAPATDDMAAALAQVTSFHSAVDISHRNVGILVAGERAEATLAAGCPQDLSLASFPVGACSRTVFGKIEIVLWRTGEDAFRVECWRSFCDYALKLLGEAARDAAA